MQDSDLRNFFAAAALAGIAASGGDQQAAQWQAQEAKSEAERKRLQRTGYEISAENAFRYADAMMRLAGASGGDDE